MNRQPVEWWDAPLPELPVTIRSAGRPTVVHEIRWEFDRDRVIGHPVCNAPPDADCRLTPGPECDCPEWAVEHDEAGAFHSSEGSDKVHRMHPGGECSVVTFIEDNVEDSAHEWSTFVIGTTNVDPVWVPGGCQWKPVGP